MTDSVKEIAERIARLEKKLAGPSSPQLIHSTIEGGATTIRSDTGALVGWIGKQWDNTFGAYVVGGPQPPTPAAPTVTSKNGSLLVEWHGDWDPAMVDGTPMVAPMDFGRVEVHVGTASQLPAGVTRSTLKTFISTPRGAVASIDLDFETDYFVWLVVRSLAGVASAPSPVIGPVQVDKLTADDLAIDFDAIGGNQIFFGAAAPTAGKIGDVWNKWVNSPALPSQYEAYRWDGDSWERLRDQEAAAAALTAEAAQAAAVLRARLYTQDEPPTGLTASDTAIWVDTNDGNHSYSWSGTGWVSRQIGTAALQPASIVASTVLATGTITAPLLEAIMVLASVIIAGDPTGEHTRLDSTGLYAYAVDDEGLPTEVGRWGRGWGVRDPATGQVVASTNDEGDGAFRSLSTTEPDINIGGTLLSSLLWNTAWGIQSYGRLAGGGTDPLTNTELGFMELQFTAVAGRTYKIMIEPIELTNKTSTGGAFLRMRYTTDGTTPVITSTQMRAYNRANDTDASWNDMVPAFALYNGPVDPAAAPQTVRVLLSYSVGTGTQQSQGTGLSRNQAMFFWVEDIGAQVEETGNESSGNGTATSGTTTAPPTTAKQTYTWEQPAAWQRTWSQSGSIIHDTEMHQGYGDSSNGIRQSAAGWTPPSMTGATVNSIEIYLESYHWWNMSGGTAYIGWHGAATERSTWPAGNNFGTSGFTARSQGKWINVTNWTNWKNALQTNVLKGITLSAPSTSATYYGKFRGEGYASGRPRIRIKYTK